ncbi:hypothetical protein [Flavisolibacter tropicus]|uniref:Methyltransferase n=1 Tax=Flavisolibacter tropicus TaxID=1492898 RepID=A0A172TZC6_9BACT|nr:hypothetical protein [Flavisolibacter tropicus]ANE52459.1 hypothetical protein SY85_20215 [Flavisolibacter tropicus]
MFLKRIFQQTLNVQERIALPKAELVASIEKNRRSLELIDNWIDDVAFLQSVFNYGVPDFIKSELNKPIDNQPTYSDYIVAIANKHFDSVSYFEIGVSVGKNFFQMINGINNASFTGLDIEEINPIIEKKLQLKDIVEWDRMEGSIKKNKSSLRKYVSNGKEVKYLSADVWDQNSWSKLSGNKFNIIFSDALHTPEAILFEFEMLVKFNLLSEKFIIIWDDLVGSMKDSFYKIIKRYDKAFKVKDVYLLNVNGWVGQHEQAHTIGILSNFEV